MRLHDWPERLSAAIAAAAGTPFDYGQHDCCLFAADCVLAVTGVDLAADWRGRYGTEASGLKLAKVRSVAQLAGRYFQEVEPVFAHRGDLAVAPLGRRGRLARVPLLFVVDGPLLRTYGAAAIPRVHATRAWRVE